MNTPQPVVVEKTLAAPASQIWAAITDKEQMKQWYFVLSAFRPEVGFEFQFYGTGVEGEKFLHHCKITDVVKEKKLRYSWRYNGYEGMSYVCFELFSEGATTLLKLTHEGIETFPVTANNDFSRANFNAGWTELIGKLLPDFLEKQSETIP